MAKIVFDSLLSLPAPLQSVCSCDDEFETTDVCPEAVCPVFINTQCAGRSKNASISDRMQCY